MLFKIKGKKYAKIVAISQNFEEGECVVSVHLGNLTNVKGEEIFEVLEGRNIGIPRLDTEFYDAIGKLVVDALKEETTDG